MRLLIMASVSLGHGHLTCHHVLYEVLQPDLSAGSLFGALANTAVLGDAIQKTAGFSRISAVGWDAVAGLSFG